ncbi:MAG: GNAT family protein [Chitinophagaceae bacterium]|jgi:RimJ/RimL family protein N-acetyltransferase|nr:GNAT family protein [Chitinophagaceae bacterium]
MDYICCNKNNPLLHLLPFTQDDFERLIQWVGNAEDLMQFAGPSLQYPITKTQLQEYIAVKARTPYKVCYQQEVIGHCAITDLNESSAMLNHILIGECKFRNLGLGKQIVKEMLQIIFENMNIQSAELYVFDWNIGAIKCYKQIGFVEVPTDFKIREVCGSKWKAYKMVLKREDYFSNNPF